MGTMIVDMMDAAAVYYLETPTYIDIYDFFGRGWQQDLLLFM